MDIRLLIRKLFNIPSREFRELFRRYSDAEKTLDNHIREISSYSPIKGTIEYKRNISQATNSGIPLYCPARQNERVNAPGNYSEYIKNLGISVADYTCITSLCQKAEIAYDSGDIITARAIVDSINEFRIPTKAKPIQDYIKKLQAKIK